MIVEASTRKTFARLLYYISPTSDRTKSNRYLNVPDIWNLQAGEKKTITFIGAYEVSNDDRMNLPILDQQTCSDLLSKIQAYFNRQRKIEHRAIAHKGTAIAQFTCSPSNLKSIWENYDAVKPQVHLGELRQLTPVPDPNRPHLWSNLADTIRTLVWLTCSKSRTARIRQYPSTTPHCFATPCLITRAIYIGKGSGTFISSAIMDTSGLWDTQDPTLSVPSQDDFQHFFENMHSIPDTLQFDFDFSQQQPQSQQMIHQDGMSSMNTAMVGSHQMGHDGTMQEHMPSMTTSSNHPAILGTPIVHPRPATEVELDAQIQCLQQQKLQQQQLRQSLAQQQQRNFYAQSRMIPPTPNSMEIHGANQHFYTQAEQPPSVYEPYRLREQEVSSIDSHLATFSPKISHIWKAIWACMLT